MEQNFDFESLQKFVNTYDPCSLSAKSQLLDMLYGVGLALDGEQYAYADGFKRFLEYLRNEVIPEHNDR